VKFLSPIALILLFSLAFVVVGWFLLGRFAALLRDRKEDQSLHAVVLGLKGLKIEEHAKEIIQYLSRLPGGLREISGWF